MPESGPSHSNEGWHAYEHAGYALTAALYVLAFVGCAVAAVMFAIYFPRHHARPWPQPFPEPRLNGRIDRDPRFSYAPRRTLASAVDPAMRALAAKGDAGWAPQGGTSPALERVPAPGPGGVYPRAGGAGPGGRPRLNSGPPVHRQGHAPAWKTLGYGP